MQTHTGLCASKYSSLRLMRAGREGWGGVGGASCFVRLQRRCNQTCRRQPARPTPTDARGTMAATALESASLLLFVGMVAALGLGLVTGLLRRSGGATDRLLIGCFSIMLFVAWFFEPWVVWLCGWEGLATAECQRTLTGRLWLFYARSFDPIFLDLPLWLRIVCSLDTLLFGPFYAASVYALATRRLLSRWYLLLALPMCGALIYSTIVYFAFEAISPDAAGARLGWVALINLPWTLAPALLLLRIGQALPRALPPTSERGRARKRD